MNKLSIEEKIVEGWNGANWNFKTEEVWNEAIRSTNCMAGEGQMENVGCISCRRMEDSSCK